jgi:hypothetical protein
MTDHISAPLGAGGMACTERIDSCPIRTNQQRYQTHE